MGKLEEQIVESLLAEENLTEADVRGLLSTLERFGDLLSGHEWMSAFEGVQSVKPDVWGHLPGEVVGGLKSKVDSAVVAATNLMNACKVAIAKAQAYKPTQTNYSGYDTAAHSGGVD